MLRLLVGASIALLVLFVAAAVLDAEAGAPTPGAKAALAVTDGFVVPRYRALAAAADTQAHAWDAACTGHAKPNEQTLRAAYNALADRWAEVEPIKNGPMSLFLRAERFNYWPEARNATSRDLDALLAANDPKMFDPAKLAHDDIPAQGLPAIERLLYEPAYVANPHRCTVGKGIAANVARIAHDVLNEWSGTNGVRTAIAADKGWNNNLFANASEAASMLLTDLVGGFTFMNDSKLLTPMSASAAAAKPKLVEAWRSGRSQRNLALNVAALHEIARLFAADIPAAERRKLESAMAAAEAAVKALPADIGAAVSNNAQRTELTAARTALKAAQAAVVAVLPSALNISVGFNSLDGD